MHANFEKENIAYFPNFVSLHKIDRVRFSAI
jgi:hypothetical protein